MTFASLLSAFIGRTVEVVVPGALFDGKLTAVQDTLIQVEEPPTVYGGPPITVSIPSISIDLVRVLA